MMTELFVENIRRLRNGESSFVKSVLCTFTLINNYLYSSEHSSLNLHEFK